MKRGKSNQDKKRKEERLKEKKYLEEADSSKTHILIFVGVVLFFVLFYVITLQITNKNEAKKTDTETVESTGEILLGRSFNMSDKSYYVLYYDTTNEEVVNTCKSMFSSYRSANGEESIYYVDMNSGFNKSYVTTEETNKSVEQVSDLRINGPTLIRIEQNHIVEYVEGLDNIQGILG